MQATRGDVSISLWNHRAMRGRETVDRTMNYVEMTRDGGRVELP